MAHLSNIRGNIIPIPGFYKSNLSIDYSLYNEFVDLQVEGGNKIFYLAKSASEFKFMSLDERIKIVDNVCKHTEI